MASGRIHLKNGAIEAGAVLSKEDEDKAKRNNHNRNNRPDKDNTNTRTLDVKHDIFVLLEINFWKVLRAASVLDL